MEAQMQAFLQRFQDLKISLEEITSATNNFDDEKNCIGVGGFGKVYKGEVSHSKGRSMVAIKRLDRRHGQGTPEFLKEITMLSRYKHENLLSLLGFCYEGNEMILMYEHASRGSLDHHLNSPHLSWSQRLKICLDASRGISYLHDPRNTHQRLIHCDVKSANILLNDQWNGKVSDFGLSIMGSANEQHSVIITHAAGTPGYCDPQYARTHTLTKESDVYSFGVVLFEVLCGTLCCTYSNGRVQRILVPTWIESYKQKKINDIIFNNQTIQPLDQSASEIFSDIAYRCLKESREDRPNMAEVVTELEAALEFQVSEWKKLFDYEEMIKSAKPPLKYKSKGELRKLLSKGVLLNGGTTWFSLNKKGEHCEMISFRECLDPVQGEIERDQGRFMNYDRNPYYLRFDMAPYYFAHDWSVKTRVRTQFLLPGITYTVNLVYKYIMDDKSAEREWVAIKYKLQGDTKTSVSYLPDLREDHWLMSELYQFTSDHKIIDLEIMFDGLEESGGFLHIEGIEFRPVEEHKVEQDENLDMHPISDSDANWVEELPNDYEDIMKRSTDNMQWTTKKEAYSIIRKGFLIDDGKKWFFLDKKGKKCHMLSSAEIWGSDNDMLPLPESRFGEAFQKAFQSHETLKIHMEINYQLLSSETVYNVYLVYKLPEDKSGFEAPVAVRTERSYWNDWFMCLVSPQTPVIRPKAYQNTYNPLNRPQIYCLPQQRNDGWMEVEFFAFDPFSDLAFATATKSINNIMKISLSAYAGNKFKGLIIQGVEFRAI